MDRTTVEDALFPACPIRNILARLCDKWSLVVIYTLNQSDKETIRFKELQREIPDISQKMLTVTLLPRSSPAGGVCADRTKQIFITLHKRADKMGAGPQRGDYERPEKESFVTCASNQNSPEGRLI